MSLETTGKEPDLMLCPKCGDGGFLVTMYGGGSDGPSCAFHHCSAIWGHVVKKGSSAQAAVDAYNEVMKSRSPA